MRLTPRCAIVALARDVLKHSGTNATLLASNENALWFCGHAVGRLTLTTVNAS